jgi:hypothetical protein
MPPARMDLELQRLTRIKQSVADESAALGPEMINFFKKSVEKRHSHLARIAQVFSALLPGNLIEHCSLESYSRGTLTILVDSSPHLYELKQELLAGLQQQLLFLCKSTGLRKILLKPGRWYSGESPLNGKLRF